MHVSFPHFLKSSYFHGILMVFKMQGALGAAFGGPMALPKSSSGSWALPGPPHRGPPRPPTAPPRALRDAQRPQFRRDRWKSQDPSSWKSSRKPHSRLSCAKCLRSHSRLLCEILQKPSLEAARIPSGGLTRGETLEILLEASLEGILEIPQKVSLEEIVEILREASLEGIPEILQEASLEDPLFKQFRARRREPAFQAIL